MVEGSGFDTLLEGQTPPEDFNKGERILSNECLEEIVEALVHRRSQISPDSQDVIDSELLSFLSRNQRKISLEKETTVSVDIMPLSTLNVREYSQIQILQEKAYGNIFERGLSGLTINSI